jgi:O-antigen/teichoic acid export membrane protein
MGYILRAKSSGGLFFATELYSSICYLAATWVGIRYIGLEGIGIAYFAYNVLYFVLIYRIVHKKFGFSFIPKSYNVLGVGFITTGAAFVLKYIIPTYYIPLNVIIIIMASLYSYKQLNFSQWVARILNSLRRKE